MKSVFVAAMAALVVGAGLIASAIPADAQGLRTSSYPRDRQDPVLATCWKRHVGPNFDVWAGEKYAGYQACANRAGLQPRQRRAAN